MIDLSLPVAVAMTMAVGAIATGYAEAAIGSAAAGAVAEKPEVSNAMLLYLVIPETIIIFSFVIAVLMMLWLKPA
ncbi:MAG: ATPase [Candidatus Micrarchaeota archaeon]|nr:ATPase [Candidatus Micrarchaeota archaeon]